MNDLDPALPELASERPKTRGVRKRLSNERRG
jgi:hypothetical protein